MVKTKPAASSAQSDKKQKVKGKKATKGKAKPARKKHLAEPAPERAKVLNSDVMFQGPIFRVTRDRIVEPNGREGAKDVVRHNGSAVILAVDAGKSKKDPWIVMERQYRHAANRFLWELPAGTLNPGEDAMAGAQRELEEETGYRARKWKLLVEYFASPGFLGESMKVYLAEGLVAGQSRPEDDEDIELRLVKLSEILKLIEKGGIMDGKTLSSVLLFAYMRGFKRKK